MYDQSLRSFVDMANRNECFSDFSKQKNAIQGKIAFLSFPYMGDREEYLETPSPSLRVCTDGRRTFARKLTS